MKICVSCQIEKSKSDFSKCSARKDGLQAYCRSCAKLKKRRWDDGHQDHTRAYAKSWRETNPEKFKEQRAAIYERNKVTILARNKAWAEKNKDKSRAIGLKHYHKHKVKYLEYRKTYYSSNKDQISLAQLARRRSNPDLVRAQNALRRARKRAAPGRYTDSDIQDIGRLQKWKCAACLDCIKDAYHIDHIHSLSKGGSNDRTNLQLLCPTCNVKKNDKDPIDFMQSRGFLL